MARFFGCLRCKSTYGEGAQLSVITLAGEYHAVLCVPCRNDYVEACKNMLEWRVLVGMRTESEIALAKVQAGHFEAADKLRQISQGYDIAVLQMHEASKRWVEQGKQSTEGREHA